MTTVTTYPFAEQFAALLGLLRDAEFRVHAPGGIEPAAPYLEIHAAGWEQESGTLKPLVGVAIIHAQAANEYAIAHAAATEGVLYALLPRLLLPRGASGAVEEDGRLVSRSVWRMA